MFLHVISVLNSLFLLYNLSVCIYVCRVGWDLDTRGSKVLKTLDNKHAGIQETLDTVGKAAFVVAVHLVVDLENALVLHKE